MLTYTHSQILTIVGFNASSDVIIWSCVLVFALVLAFVAVVKVKKRIQDNADPSPGTAGGFTLADLRQLHRTGQISDEELEKAKAKIVEAAKKAADRYEEERKRKAGIDGSRM